MRNLPMDDDGRPYDPDAPKRFIVKFVHPTRGAGVHYYADRDALREGIMDLLEQKVTEVKVHDRDPRCARCGAKKPSSSAGCPVRKSIGAREHDRAHPSGGRNNPTKVAKDGRAAWGYRICSRCQGYGWDRMNRPCKTCGGSGQVHKGVMKHGRRPNPSHPDCPGVSSSHRHTQGKCATDWNWGVGTMSRQARKVWPSHHAYAIVQPAAVAGRWQWKVLKSGGNFVGEGESGSSNAAKAAAVEFVKHQRWVLGPRRRNPGLGMPGMPHTWVTSKGVHVSAGDTVEYWSKEGLAYDARPEKRRAKVLRALVFDDHVQVNRGPFGNTVNDRNFIRVVRNAPRSNPVIREKTKGQCPICASPRAVIRSSGSGSATGLPWLKCLNCGRVYKWHSSRRTNPILSVISNPLLSIASNPARRRRRKRR